METLNHPIFSALGDAILHSLWQFFVLIVLAYMLAGQFKSARHRHNIYLLTMLTLPLVFGATFWLSLPAQMTQNINLLVLETPSTVVQNIVVDNPVAQDFHLMNWLTTNGRLLLSITYLSGLFVLTLKSGRELWQIRQLRFKSIAPSTLLSAHYERLNEHFPGLKNYPLRLSQQVGSALTIGVFRPFILLPLSLVSELEPEELEAIILHEMAHLFRRDHLWNALQTLLTQLFFYHPLLYWLGRQMDKEREYACDDLVTGQIDRKQYAQSLVRAAQYSITHKKQFVMQAQGKSHFTQRIQRIFIPAVEKRSRRWLLLPLLLLPMLYTAVVSAQKADVPVDKAVTLDMPDQQDSTLYFLGGKRYNSFEDFAELLERPSYFYTRGTTDKTLQTINAEEGTAYAQIARYYSGGIPVDSIPEGEGEIEFENVSFAPVTVDEMPMFENGKKLDDAEAFGWGLAFALVAMSEDEDEPQFATFIDDIPFHENDVSDLDYEIMGQEMHIFDDKDAKTIEHSQKDGKEYAGTIVVKTTQEEKPTTFKPDETFQLNDSILIFVNGVLYDKEKFRDLPVEAIEQINVHKGNSLPEQYRDQYSGMIKISLKPGYDVEDLLSKSADKTRIHPVFKDLLIQELQDGKVDFENAVILINGQESDEAALEKLATNRIIHIEIIKKKKDLKRLGYKKSKAVIKIETKD